MSIIKTFISTWEEDLAVYQKTLMTFHAHLQNNLGHKHLFEKNVVSKIAN